MSGRRNPAATLVKLWLLAALVGGLWIWLSGMDGKCTDGLTNPSCVTDIYGHTFAPFVGWIALVLGALAVIATLVTLVRRAFR
jgi:hypothetical protein